MANLLVAGILLLAVGVAVAYIVKAKKSGTKCIGCPSGAAALKRVAAMRDAPVGVMVQRNKR